MKSFSGANENVAAYAEKVFHPEDEILLDIRERAKAAGLPDIHIGAMDGLHLELLTRASGARKIVEIGTLAGYSGVCLARGMAADGRLYTFEFSPLHAEIARRSFAIAGFAEKVEMHIGRAVVNLPKIESLGPFDLVFIDADKPSYPDYFLWAIKNVRIGGMILLDNTFAGGEIAGPDRNSTARLRAIHQCNSIAASDERLRSTILPTSDGMTLSVRVK